jgi:hypothetical protein
MMALYWGDESHAAIYVCKKCTGSHQLYTAAGLRMHHEAYHPVVPHIETDEEALDAFIVKLDALTFPPMRPWWKFWGRRG